MSDIQQAPESLRDTLTANFESAEAGTLPSLDERPRDEVGRFAPKPKEEAKPAAQPQAAPVEAPRLTTWKKDYLPLHDKLGRGEALTPDEAKKLHDYNFQRENEYKTGVSTYRTEAQNAKEIQEAITPFVSEMQARGITPANWIKDVGQAHYILVKGSPQQKAQLLSALCTQYGVPMAAVQQTAQGQQVNPVLAQIMQANDALRQELGQLRIQVGGVINANQQQEMVAIQHEIQKMNGDAQTYPHFDEVREEMAQLIEKLVAPDIPSAYNIAIAMRPDLIDDRVNRLVEQKMAGKGKASLTARSRAVSPKSATPSGQVTTATDKDRRSQLEEAYDATVGGRV